MSPFHVILTVMFLSDVLWCWLAFRSMRKLGRPALGVLASLLGLVQLAGLAIIFLSRSNFPGWIESVPRWVYGSVLVWHLFFVPGWLLWQVARMLSAGAKRIARMPRKPAPAPAAEGWTRREFLGASAVLTPPMLAFGAAALGETQLDSFRIRRMVVPIKDLPPALEGLTIAHVTDVHVGRFTRDRVLEKIVEETNRLDADIVAMTGDLINDSLRAMPAALEMARGLRGRVFTCEGNHDLIESASTFYRQAEKGGLPLLRNDAETVTIRGQKVQLLGLPWKRNATGLRDSMRELLARRDPAAWPILLAHHPHAWDEAEGIPLTLAGHTHGGQLMLTERVGFGPWIYRYWSGLYTRPANESALVVSNGVGNWFPVRVQAPAEILHLTLRSVGEPMTTSESSSESSAGPRAAVSGGGLRIREVSWT